MESDILIQLARIGHQVWSDDMRRAGWSYGVKYSEDNRTHDALVEFEKLPEVDVRSAVLKIQAEGIATQLGNLVVPDRSDTRPFSAVELHVGMRVGWAGDDARPAEPGSIESWTVDDKSGDVLSITVTWRDGETTTVGASVGLLRRIED